MQRNCKLCPLSSTLVFLRDDCKDVTDMERHIKYIYCKGNYLIRNFSKCSIDVKTKLFKTFCNAIYGGHLWTNFSTAELQKVNVSFNNVFRHLFHIPYRSSISYNLLMHKLDSFKVLQRKYAYSFRKRIFNSNNLYIKCISLSLFFNRISSMSVLWSRDLYVTT